MGRFRVCRGAAVAVAAALALSSAVAVGADAATTSTASDEIGGTSVAAHLTAQNFRNAWLTQVAANGGTASSPMTLNQPTYTNGSNVSGVINTAADGTTTSVARTRYTAGSSPTLVGNSTNPGTATCTSAGESLQGGAPRPTLLNSDATCSNSAGFAYNEVGGTGENTTRDAVEFTFSRPVLGFGAWFGDLETRTDGSGLPALVRLYDAGGTLLSEKQVVPGPNYLPQSNCGGTYTGCGNNTTRWISFVADPALPVTRMVVIVGDDDPTGSGLDEGMSFIGPTLDLSRATISLAKTANPLTDTNSDGIIGAGDTIHYKFTVTNTGSLTVTSVAITDPSATGMSCPVTTLAASASVICTGNHVLTQAQVNAGSFSNTASATASAYGGTITSNSSTLVFPIASSPGLTLTKTVTEPTYSAVGDVLHFQLTATNTGNVTLTGLSVSDPNPGAGSFSTTCGAVPTTLAPHSTTSCAATYAVTQADLNAGTLTNIGSASATAPGSVAVGPVTGSATSIAIQQRGLSLQKSVDHLTYDAVGNVLTYTLTATNTGNVTMTGVNVTDTPPGAGAFAINCAALPSTLAPGAQGNCTATYTVTQDDLDSGTLTNVAQAHGTAAGVAVNSPPASATSTVVTHPGLGLAKTVDAPSYAAVGDVLTYTISLTNSGNVRVHGLSVDDTAPGAGAFNLDCSALPVRLQPGATATCTATYAVTQADLDAGTVVNQAQASGLLPNNDPVTSPLGSATSVAQQSASLSLVKTADPATYSEAGDVVSYDVTVTNEGNVTLHGVTVTDPAPGSGAFNLNCAGVPATLGPGDVGTCTATYAVTQADVDAGSVENVASVTATGPSGTVTAPDASVTTTAEQVPELRVRKRVDLDTYSVVGDVFTYTITVTNTGNVTLTGVDASDAAPGDGAFDLDCASLPSTLAPGAHGTCTATYTVTQTDLDAGAVVNSAQGTATSPTGLVDAGSLPVTSTAVQSATIQVQKMVNAPTYNTVGDVLTYPITVTNTGNVTLTSVAVDDVSPGTGAFSLDCSGLPSTLAPGGNGTCTATYTVTQADLDSGSVTNAATASGVGPSGTASAPESRVTSTANQNAALSVRKSVDADVYSSPGDVLTYTITVTNSGNVTLSSVDVDDPAPGAGAFALDCGALPAVLAPGGQGTCTATYAVTQADIDGGSVTNEASATASSPAGPVDAASLPVTSTALAASDLQITKTVDASSYSAVGDVLTYTITVTNNGNVTLDNVEVADPAPGAGAFALDCTNLPSSLAPAADGTCTATYAVTQADLDAGTVVNTAQANATDPGDNAVHSSNASATSTAAEAPSIDIDKSVDATLYRSVGDVLTYTIIVTNNGNVTLTDVAATDIAPGGGAFALDCAFLPVVLAPNDSGTCTATYAVTQQDLNVGSVTNTADVSASSPAGPVGATSPGVTSTAVRSAALDISKDVDASTYDAVDDVLTYTITATNTGNVTIHSVDVADAAPGAGAFALDCGSLPAVLAPGDNGTCTATYTVTQADLDGGTVANTAHASGLDPGGDPVRSGDATATSTADELAAFGILKTVDAASYDAVGDVLTYTVAVTNSGNVTLTGVNVTDVAPGSGEFSLDCASLAAVLAPGDGGSCTATYAVTQADLNSGHVTNVAHAHGTAPGGPVNAASAPVTSLADQTATLDVRKTVDAPTYDAVGDVLTYAVTVTNSGNVTLSSVALTDAAPGSGAFALDCGALPSTLAPGEHGDCSATYSVTQADLDAGSVTNTARADAVDPNAASVRSPNDSATSTATASGALQVAKSVNAVTYDAVGDVLTYSVTVTNAGNVTLTGVDVVDAAPGAGTFSLDCAALPAVLAPGDGGSCTATYVVTQADLDGGSVVNRAHAIGTDPANDPVRSANDSATSTAVVSASLSIVKSVDTATYNSVGDVLTYTIDVTNTGNVTLAQVDLVDHAPGGGSYSLDCASLPSILAPGDGGTCTATYSVTQADLDGGSVVNTAHAEGTDPSDNPVQSADATATSTFNGSSSLAVTKTVDAATYNTVGDLLTYTVTVTNAGSVTLSDVIVTDVAPGPGAYNIDCGALPDVLEPGDTGTCTATYAVTQADLDAGSVVNVAFANAVKPGGDPVRSSNASATSTATDAPSLGLVKTVGTKTYDAVGDTLRYTITVTNTGNVRLSEVAVTDQAPGGGAFALDCADLPDTLAPGDSGRCSATYSVTQADLDAGSVLNTAHASAVDPRGRTRTADAASASSAANQVEALTLAKVVQEDSFAAVGDVLHYKITTRNTGNVTLRHVEVDDPAPGDGAYSTTCGAVGSLAPGAVSTCKASYTITSADLESDGVTNTATVSATGQVSAVSASATSAAPTGDGGGPLPGTGAKNLHNIGFAGIGLLLLGLAFIVASRRRRPLS